jgi:hypothetical protein
VKMSARVKKGTSWAKYVTYLWLAFAAFKALFGLALEDPGKQIATALMLAIAGPVLTAPFAFAAGWLLGGKSEESKKQ